MALLAAGLLAAGALTACADPAGEQAGQAAAAPLDALPGHFPSDFPVPDHLVPAGGGDAAAFAVDDPPGSVVDFYEEQLATDGWEIIDRWEGFGPHGDDAHGLSFSRDDSFGALSVSEGDAYASVVQITLQEDTDDGGEEPPHQH